MSGIYIPGMKMPKAGDCIVVYPDGEVWGGGKCIGTAIELPPHGRLIDADALKIYQMEENVRADGDPNEYEYDAGLIDGLHMAAKDVSVAPTVIPPEGGDANV
jgi:hypothetical protein